MVVMFEIVVPGVEAFVVSKGSIGCHGSPGNEGAQRGESHLSVKRRVDAALRTEARKLRADDTQFLRARYHVAVARRIVRDRRVDIEAIDRRFRIGGPLLARQLAARGNDRRGQINGAGILPAWATEPRFRFT